MPRFLPLALLLAALLPLATPAAAQTPTNRPPFDVHVDSVPVDTIVVNLDAPRVPMTPARVLTVRSLTGVGGALVGGVAVGLVASEVLPQTQCGDDPGLCEFVRGAAVGALAGGVVAAALPRLGSRCTFRQRALTGLGAGALGWVLGLAIGGDEGTVLLTVPIGSGIGAAAGASHC